MDTLGKIQNLLSETCQCDPADIKLETLLVADLDIDSFLLLEFITDVEKEFNVSVSDRDIAKIRSVSDMINYLNEHAT